MCVVASIVNGFVSSFLMAHRHKIGHSVL